MDGAARDAIDVSDLRAQVRAGEAQDDQASGALRSACVSAISKLSAGFAHEARNPLNALAIYLEVIGDKIAEQTGGTLSPYFEKNLSAAKIQVARLDDLIRGYSSLVSARTSGSVETDLVAIVSDAIMLCGYELRQSNVEASVEGSGEFYVRGNAQDLVMALVMLLQGVCACLPGGGAMVFTMRRNGEVVWLNVEVDGIDISTCRTAKSSAFESFEGHRGSPRFVDLWSVREIVRSCGGDVSASQSANRRVRIEWSLPLALSVASPGAAVA